MRNPASTLGASVIEYCTSIGSDPMLVQGAGGNASWKEGDILWIKASGTWLSDAAHQDIFVPVDLGHLQDAIAAGDFAVKPKLHGDSKLRPSIETLLHALLPHPVVVHLHAIEILAHLVRHNFEAEITERLGDNLCWTSTGYQKPGAALAQAVGASLARVAKAEVVFLQNHGVVIGGEDIAAVANILNILIERLRTPCRPLAADPLPHPLAISDNARYVPVSDPAIHQLATDPALFSRLSSDWALYPDHVVFLGATPACYADFDAVRAEHAHNCTWPELVFIRDSGVYTQPEFSIAKQAQLRCYYDVLSRQPDGYQINALRPAQIAELLDWDAEQYRKNIAK